MVAVLLPTVALIVATTLFYHLLYKTIYQMVSVKNSLTRAKKASGIALCTLIIILSNLAIFLWLIGQAFGLYSMTLSVIIGLLVGRVLVKQPWNRGDKHAISRTNKEK